MSSSKGGGRGGKVKVSYTAPSIPSFLQKLHAQVHSGSSSAGGKADADGRMVGSMYSQKRPTADGDYDSEEQAELAALFPGGEGSKEQEGKARARFKGDVVKRPPAADAAAAAGGDEEDDDPPDEWDGAQVVVLKEGRHLTEDEVRETKRRLQDEREKEAAEQASASTAGQIATGSSSQQPRKRPRIVGDSGGDEDNSRPLDVSTSSSSTAKTDPLAAAKDLIASDKKRKKEAERAKEKEKKAKDTKREKKRAGKGLSFDVED